MKKSTSGIGAAIVLVLIVAIVSSFLMTQQPTEQKIYIDLVEDLKNDKIASLEISDDTALATYKEMDEATGGPKTYTFTIPSISLLREQVTPEKFDAVQLDIQPPPTIPWYVSLLTPLLFLVAIGAFWFFVMRQQGGGSKAMSFGKSKARVVTDDTKKVTFADVAGVDEEKEELREIVEFLKAPKKFVDLGARIPKGVLLVGPPGTGKTLLAKAVAGEAGVPFFSISGSDFVEMFVGVGASRVRDLFDQAKKNQPSIIFIDEIDAVGRHRGAGMGGGHDEREQTLNQMLVEMDGFGANEGVIVIAATNRADILDPALMRPGRFDRQVYVGYPDQKGREAILKVHAKNKPLAEEVNLESISKITYGFTGADLENLLNEGALLAARSDRKEIIMQDIDEAMLKVVMGPEKKTHVVTERDKETTAYHEAGHAILAELLPTQDAVHQVSIIPRGRAGGFTMFLPDKDKTYVSKQAMLEDICVSLGGRIAELLVFNELSTGASGDLKHVTEVATNMITRYGMSEALGSRTFETDNEIFIGRDYGHTKAYSEATAAEIDREIKTIIDQCFAQAQKLVSDNRDKLERVAKALLEKEKLDGDEFRAVFYEQAAEAAPEAAE